MNKKLQNELRKHKTIVFLDFEGTQFSHEMIAIGGIAVTINPKTGRIVKRKNPFKVYVKAHNKIGNYVTNLTGITEAMLKEKGVSLDTALKALKKYVGISFKGATFVTFGNHDMRILNQSIAYNLVYPKDVTSQIQKNYFDFLPFVSEFIRDEIGNPMSLIHYCELFGVPEAGTAHDPEVDAINLANLYDAFLEKSDLVIDEYKKHLGKHTNNLPYPVAKAIAKLANGEAVTPEEFEQYIKEYLR